MLIRTLSALQDRKNLTLRILVCYLIAAFVGIALEHYIIDALLGPGHYWAKLTLDTAIRVGIGLALFIFASKLIRSQESVRDNATVSALELLQRLALASEFRDDVTAAHNSRIGQYAAIVAEELGLPAQEQEILRYAASLHDIGKVAIPDSILQKPGPLTSEERQQMQKHVLYGADLLLGGRHPVMDAAYNIALTHHEAWNGKGYPNGLSGAQIPLCGRIVGLCDTFDALLSERPYKESWPVEDAVIEVLRLSGKRFDPIVVAAFHRALPKIMVLQRQPLPRKLLRPPASYQPTHDATNVNPTLWDPLAVQQAQEANDLALGKLLLTETGLAA